MEPQQLTLMFEPEAQGATWPRRPPLLWTCWESKQCDNRTSTREASMPSTFTTGQQLLQDSRTTVIYFDSKPIRKWNKMYQNRTKYHQQQAKKQQPLRELPLLLLHSTNTTTTNLTKQSFCCSLRTTEQSLTLPKSVQQPI